MPSRVEPLRIELGPRSYEVRVGSGLIGDPATYRGLPSASAAVIVTNEAVAALYGERLAGALRQCYSTVSLISLEDGEASKTWSSIDAIVGSLLGSSRDRRTVLFALGGGVVGDITGFAAACYMRGIAYVQVPTTLLAQVDSSVGGKTAINHPLGKNMMGAFHQPLRVIADLDTLTTLPRRELVAGLAEAIKYGAIADDDFLAWIDLNLDRLLNCEPTALLQLVRRSCEIKAAVVSGDERELGNRAILNFGHTFGHAIEAGVGFGTWLHGEAVGCGMLFAADLSCRVGMLGAEHAARLARVIERAGLPSRAPDLGVHRYLELMRVDKKAEAGELRFVLLQGPGKAELLRVSDSAVTAAIEKRMR